MGRKAMEISLTKSLLEEYEGNSWFITQLCEGISHEESLIHPGFEANCFNWVLGHILSRRISVLEVLGLESIWPAEVASLYRTGSDPISSESARNLGALIGDLENTDQLIKDALEGMTEEYLEDVVETDRGEKQRWEHLEGFHWHETFHMGQLDMLRALALSRRQNS
jgi:uncharacterized damage-inducible protein DinB